MPDITLASAPAAFAASCTAANEAKTLFLATMSHEIRTPLHCVLCTLELLALTRLDAQHRPLPFGASLESVAGKQIAIADTSGKALALIEEDAGTLVIKWGDQQCRAAYSLGERNKALNYEQVALSCSP